MEKQRDKGFGIDKVIVKALANTAKDVAMDSIGPRCHMFIHEPDEPKDLAARLKAMK